jgi:predicted transcriptional regulator of viral defense system
MTRQMSTAQAVQAAGRPVFTSREIAALRGSSVSATSRALKRMARQGLIANATRGVWCVPSHPRYTPFALVPYLTGGRRAYVSFFSALHLHGLIEQIPRVIYVATTGHTRIARTAVATYSLHRIHTDFFAGYDWYRDGHEFLIASPEKALVDCLYLASRRGRRFGHFPELDLTGGFSIRRARDWVARIRDPRIRAHAARRLRQIVKGTRPRRR